MPGAINESTPASGQGGLKMDSYESGLLPGAGGKTVDGVSSSVVGTGAGGAATEVVELDNTKEFLEREVTIAIGIGAMKAL
jgi:hypothetical protein